jgi:hypothetical protein
MQYRSASTKVIRIAMGESMNTKFTTCALLGAAALITASIDRAHALEPGFGGEQKGGATIGATAEAPPPGLYMIDQAFTAQGNFIGPAAAQTHPAIHLDVGVVGLLFSPGWTFLGGTYAAVIVQPFSDAGVGNAITAGLHNTFLSPIQLTWKFGDFGVTTDLGIYVPDGTIQGPTGLNNIFGGNPWWTFQPEVRVGYYKDGWALTADTFIEINTANSIDGYTSGDVLHEELTFTKTFGKWTVGPVAYYYGQVTNDKNPNGVAAAGLLPGQIGNKFNVFAAGGLVSYNFGPASLTVWAADEVSATASSAGGAPTVNPGKGWTAFATLSYRIWAPESAPPKLTSILTK